jgi:hypothetical protein
MLHAQMIRMAVLVSVCAAAQVHAAQLPRVEILYPPGGSLLDRLCKTDFNRTIDEAVLKDAVQQRADFQRRWDAEGPSYLQAALNEIGVTFPYHEMQATLTVCLPASTSIPLVIDVTPFLANTVKQTPSWEFSEILFHELMHSYVSPVFAASALMKKYQNEAATTKYHLHVMAIEKMVLLKLQRPDQLAIIDHNYRNGSDLAYRRAWEIVNDVEGPQPFLAELKALRANHTEQQKPRHRS